MKTKLLLWLALSAMVAALMLAIVAAAPGDFVPQPDGACFHPGKIQIDLDLWEVPEGYRDMTDAELAQQAAAEAWLVANRQHYNLTERVDAAAQAAFASLTEEAQVAFLQSGPHRWAGGEDARHARFKVLVSRGSYAVTRLGNQDDSTDAAILISAAARGVETDEMIARLATFLP